MAKLFLTPIDLGKLELQNARIQNLASAPGTPVTGQLYYNTGDNKLYWWNGSTWVAAEPGTPTLDYGEDPEVEDILVQTETNGVINEIARVDHRHNVQVAAPSTIGTANNVGSLATLSRADHIHQDRAHDHSNAVEGTSLAPGTLLLPLATAPAQTANGSLVWDSDGFFFTVGDGSSRRIFYAVIDATSDPVLVDGTAAADGTETSVARKDHKHLLSLGNVSAQTSFGAASNNGASNAAARTDHLHGTPTHDGAAHSGVSLSALAVPTADLSIGGFKLTNLGTPVADTDAAPKGYVDSAVAGLSWKDPVRAATTANITIATALNAADVIDGVTLANGDRVLVKNQSAPAENGIYVVAASPARATDADAEADLLGAAVWVLEGTANADTGYTMTTNAPITVGTTGLSWVQFSGLGQITAGAGLTQTGNQIDAVAGTGIVVNANDIAVVRTDANGRVPLKFAANVGDGAATSYNIDHNLNSLDVLVQVWRVSDGVQVEVDVTRSTVNRVILGFAVAPASNAYRVAVYG